MSQDLLPRRRLPPPLALDALTAHVTFRDLQDYYRRARIPISRRWWTTALIVLIYLAGQAVLIAVLLPATGVLDSTLRWVLAAFLAFTSLYFAFLLWLIRRNAVRQVRIDRAARANGMSYADRGPLGPLHGSAFVSSNSLTSDVLVAEPSETSPVGFTAATFQARPGFTLRRAGFIEVPLGRATPHLVLENRRSAVLPSTGARVRAGQRLKLEGDFDRTFALHCPVGYERDALYIFTPDLMALLLDVAADCEVELIDGHLVLYVGHPWRLWRPERFAAVHRVAEVVGGAARKRTARYRDDRPERLDVSALALPAGEPGGRRLRFRPTLGTVSSAVVSLALGAYGIVALFSRTLP